MMTEINNRPVTTQPGSSSAQKASESTKRENEQSQIASATEAKTDSVSLTSEATKLQSIQQALAETPIVNSDRVEALRAAIADGTYQVDAVELAQNIIDFETQIL